MDKIKIGAPDPQKYQEAYETYLKENMKYTSGIEEKLVKEIREQKDAAAMEFTRVICDMLKAYGVSVIATETTCGREEIDTGNYHAITEKYGVEIEGLDFSAHDAKHQREIQNKEVQIDELKKKNNCLEEQFQRKENIISQIDYVLEKLFGVTHDIAKTPAEFEKILLDKANENAGSEGYLEKQEKTNNFYGIFALKAKDLKKDDLLIFLGILTKELLKNGVDFKYEMQNEMKVYNITIKENKTISDFLPAEPIKVADMLINAEKEYEYNPLEKAFSGTGKRSCRMFDASGLRQIAEHLLVYCNHNTEAEE